MKNRDWVLYSEQNKTSSEQNETHLGNFMKCGQKLSRIGGEKFIHIRTHY